MRLRSLAVRYSDNDDLAKAMGLSVSQVQRARTRFVGKWNNADATTKSAKGPWERVGGGVSKFVGAQGKLQEQSAVLSLLRRLV